MKKYIIKCFSEKEADKLYNLLNNLIDKEIIERGEVEQKNRTITFKF